MQTPHQFNWIYHWERKVIQLMLVNKLVFNPCVLFSLFNLFYYIIFIIMAYIKRPITISAEYFRPDVYINFRSTDSVDEATSEIKKWWVFVIWKKIESGEYESKEVKELDFYSLMILDKLESEYERSDLVKNVYTEELQIKDKKTFRFVCKAKWDNNIKKFIDVDSTDELENFKVKKVLVWQLKETWEIFTLELAWTQARNLMTKNFSRKNLYNPNYDYKLTESEKEEQLEKVNLFMDWVELKLTPSKEKFKVWKDKTFKNIFLLEVEWEIKDVTLDDKAIKTIDILESQLAWKTKTETTADDAKEVFDGEEINLEDVPF